MDSRVRADGRVVRGYVSSVNQKREGWTHPGTRCSSVSEKALEMAAEASAAKNLPDACQPP